MEVRRVHFRSTVVFCSTVAHAVHVRDAFRDAGVTAAMIDGNMKDGERRGVLAAYDRGEIQVVTNCMVLTERSEEHTSELQSLMRISYAVFCLKKKTNYTTLNTNIYH